MFNSPLKSFDQLRIYQRLWDTCPLTLNAVDPTLLRKTRDPEIAGFTVVMRNTKSNFDNFETLTNGRQLDVMIWRRW
jgi:hypothetical protein